MGCTQSCTVTKNPPAQAHACYNGQMAASVWCWLKTHCTSHSLEQNYDRTGIILPGTGRDIPGRLPSTKLFHEIGEIPSEENLLKSDMLLIFSHTRVSFPDELLIEQQEMSSKFK